MWAVSYSGTARSRDCGNSPHPLSVHACACHACSLSSDTQGWEKEVTNTRQWAGARMVQINCKGEGSEPKAHGDGGGSVLL